MRDVRFSQNLLIAQPQSLDVEFVAFVEGVENRIGQNALADGVGMDSESRGGPGATSIFA